MSQFSGIVLNRRWRKIFEVNLIGGGMISVPLYCFLGINIGLYVLLAVILILVVGSIASMAQRKKADVLLPPTAPFRTFSDPSDGRRTPWLWPSPARLAWDKVAPTLHGRARPDHPA